MAAGVADRLWSIEVGDGTPAEPWYVGCDEDGADAHVEADVEKVDDR